MKIVKGKVKKEEINRVKKVDSVKTGTPKDG